MKVLFIIIFLFYGSYFSLANNKILKKIDSYRKFTKSFQINIKIIDFKNNELVDSSLFVGFFKGNKKSLLYCYKGKNKGMKILMKDNNLWINLPGSKRALRITPIQRLLGQASNGDIAKISYDEDYTIDSMVSKDSMNILYLKAKRSSATYNKIELFVKKDNFSPLKANYYLISGKHFKTAYFFYSTLHNKRKFINKVKIVNKFKDNFFTVIENFNIKKINIPTKYFNKSYLYDFNPF